LAQVHAQDRKLVVFGKTHMADELPDIAGSWHTAFGNKYFNGLIIHEDLKYTGFDGGRSDGLARVVSVEERRINMKRTAGDADDHIFIVSDDGNKMEGHCVQTGSKWTLKKAAKKNSVQKTEDPEGKWRLESSSYNHCWCCFSEPDLVSHVIHTFQSGDIVEVAEGVPGPPDCREGCEWCRLSSPPFLKGAYICLAPGSGEAQSWNRLDEAGDDDVQSLEEDEDIADEEHGEQWVLVAYGWNCRSQPNGKAKIVQVFEAGDVVLVEKHVGNDWCLLASPPSAKGAYIRLRHCNASRSWRRVVVDADSRLNILFVAHNRNGGAPDIRYANWLRSSDRNVRVSVQNYAKVKWSNDFEGYDAIVLSGGSGIEDAVWAKEKVAIVSTNKPVFGICLGMQFICKAYWDSEHPDGLRCLLKRAHDARALRPEKLDVPELGLEGKIAYFRMFGVPTNRVADCLNILCLSNAGNGPTVGIVKHKTKLCVGFQGHPEMAASDRAIYSGALKHLFCMVDEYRKTKATSENLATPVEMKTNELAGYPPK